MLAFLSRASCNTFSLRRTILSSMALLAMVVAVPSPAIAEDYCPTEPRTVILEGTITSSHGGNWENAPSVPFQSYPCEEFWVTYTVSGGSPTSQPNFFIGLTDSTNHTFATDIVAFSGSATGRLPETPEFGDPFPGTLHPSGNIAMVKVWTNRGIVPLEWTITIHLTPRPDYNRGGLTMATAPLVHDGDLLHLSLKGYYNYYKVLLKPGGTLWVSGTVTNDWQYWRPGRVTAFVYNNAQQYAGYVSSTYVNPQSTAALPYLRSYTNTSSQTAAAYLGIQADYAHLYGSSIQVHAQEADLKLFLDVDGNFDPASPTSDDAQYVPGSSLADGTSVPLPQGVQVIAAFVDATGSIIQPPSGQQVTFSLEAVSAFQGIAMNASDPRGNDFLPDLALQTATPLSFGSDKTARVTLNAWDYAARGTIRATLGSASAELRIPLDVADNGNGIPDAGWRSADGQMISDNFSVPTEDTDFDPVGDGTPGDGLGAIEEFRGFRVNGVLRRLNPERKDLFFYSEHPQSAGDGLSLPIAFHALQSGEMNVSDRIINPYYINANAGSGADLRAAGAYQRGLYIKDGGYSSSAVGVTPTSVLTPVPNDVTGPILIYTDTIRQISPPNNNVNDVDAPDEAKNNQTLGHELAHGLRVSHWRKDNSNTASSCAQMTIEPSRALSVMVTCWFAQTTNPSDPKWTSIPHGYDSVDLGSVRIRK